MSAKSRKEVLEQARQRYGKGSVLKVPQKEEVMVSSWEQLTTN
jgi:hypothetical protein